MWKSAVQIDQVLGEEVLKDPLFAPKAMWRLLRRGKKGETEETGKPLLEDIRIFRQMTVLGMGVGFVLSYNLTVWAIERFLYPTTGTS